MTTFQLTDNKAGENRLKVEVIRDSFSFGAWLDQKDDALWELEFSCEFSGSMSADTEIIHSRFMFSVMVRAESKDDAIRLALGIIRKRVNHALRNFQEMSEEIDKGVISANV